jgi:quinol monooxygenase YgiN
MRRIAVVKPRVVVALGATAAQALLGPPFRLTLRRGDVASPYAQHVVAGEDLRIVAELPSAAEVGRALREHVADEHEERFEQLRRTAHVRDDRHACRRGALEQTRVTLGIDRDPADARRVELHVGDVRRGSDRIGRVAAHLEPQVLGFEHDGCERRWPILRRFLDPDAARRVEVRRWVADEADPEADRVALGNERLNEPAQLGCEVEQRGVRAACGDVGRRCSGKRALIFRDEGHAHGCVPKTRLSHVQATADSRRTWPEMLHIVAHITAKPGRRAELLGAFQANVPAVRAEAGCIEYFAVVDAEGFGNFPAPIGPDSFTVLERWQDADAVKAHAQSPHMAAYAAATKDLVASRTIHILSEA